MASLNKFQYSLSDSSHVSDLSVEEGNNIPPTKKDPPPAAKPPARQNPPTPCTPLSAIPFLKTTAPGRGDPGPASMAIALGRISPLVGT
eukprot:CAMPEP_0172359604 /NCGR_PEP_ID=MMETSP1060-20121228/3799_1 /TAXON_ID=37318 /ORGANISM="Pseudo-nitzschia pungens, Strain cf. cingulata" /LENGTH=88 /DNA_ID=CAMNT_0013081345 /DNA_START=204 /DNA_END=471 /DNA_ORIENTATION=-